MFDFGKRCFCLLCMVRLFVVMCKLFVCGAMGLCIGGNVYGVLFVMLLV